MEETTQPVATPEAKVAEKPKKCKHAVIIIILVILLAGSLGFGLYELTLNVRRNTEDKVSQLQDNNDCDDLLKTNSYISKTLLDIFAKDFEDKYVNQKKNNEAPTQSEDGSYGSIDLIIKTNYKTTIVEKCTKDCELGENVSGYMNLIADGPFFFGSGSPKETSETINFYRWHGNFDGVVFEEDVEKTFEVSGTLVQIIAGKFGNGGEEAILMLRDDGTIAAIYYDYDNNEFVYKEKLDGFSNISALYQGFTDGGYSAMVFAVDTDGKSHSLYGYRDRDE